MNKFFVVLTCFLVAVVASLSVATAADKAEKADKKGAGSANGKKLRHVVAFKFKADASKEQIQKIVDAFRDLKKKISVIEKFEHGSNISPEKHDKGFTQIFMLTFASEKDRDEYAEHADHKAFGALLKPVLDDVFVMDYWSQK